DHAGRVPRAARGAGMDLGGSHTSTRGAHRRGGGGKRCGHSEGSRAPTTDRGPDPVHHATAGVAASRLKRERSSVRTGAPAPSVGESTRGTGAYTRDRT